MVLPVREIRIKSNKLTNKDMRHKITCVVLPLVYLIYLIERWRLEHIPLSMDQMLYPSLVTTVANQLYPSLVKNVANQLYPSLVTTVANQLYPSLVTNVANQLYSSLVTTIANQLYPSLVTTVANQLYPSLVTNVANQLYPSLVTTVASQLYPSCFAKNIKPWNLATIVKAIRKSYVQQVKLLAMGNVKQRR